MKTLIDLLLESELAEMNDKEAVDEVGKFFIVKKPGKGMTKEDIMCEMTVFDEINKEEIKGVYKQKSDASRVATEAIKQYEGMMKEVEEAMNDFRESKKSIEEKKKIAKEKIERLK
jgi:hypothetical protein